MLPVLQGTIVRRVLMNFRADPVIARRLVPKPFEIVTQNGSAVVGVCLIRLEHLRPKGLPASVGLSSENMAHRIAVRFPSATGWRPGVFIWRRETNQRLTALLGGRLFPGVHGHARFHALESEEELSLEVFTKRKEADVTFRGSRVSKWKQTGLFDTLATVSAFFAQGDCGFSRSRHGAYDARDGIAGWQMMMPCLSDGDERGQRVAHHGKAQRREELVRCSREFEGQRDHRTPGIRAGAEPARKRAEGEDGDGESAVLAVAGDDGCDEPRNVQ